VLPLWRKAVLSLSIGILAVVCAYFVREILQTFLYKGSSPLFLYAFEFLEYAIVAFLGLIIAERIALPTWWKKERTKESNLWASLLGAILVVANTAIHYYSRSQALGSAPWLGTLDLTQAFFLSLRAGVTEEIVFRLFLLCFAVWGTLRVSHSRPWAICAGVLVSSLLFGLIHPGFALPFLVGIVMAHIYLQAGLLPAMVVHFLSDFLPLSLWALFW